MRILLITILIFLTSGISYATDSANDQEFKSIEELLKYTAKMAKDDTRKSTIKYVRSEVRRVRELYDQGYSANALPLLLNIRRILYRYGNVESVEFQQNLKSVMKRLWPFILESGRFRSETHTFEGITSVILIVPEGQITLQYPEDARPGETISGRIDSNPPNLNADYLLTINGGPVVADNTLRKWNFPVSFDLIVTDVWSNELIKVKQSLAPDPSNRMEGPVPSGLQVEKQPREPQQDIQIPYLRFRVSARAKAGENLIVEGPFDGDFTTTVAGIGKYQAEILGESPRRLVLRIHPRMTGPWTILVRENQSRVLCRVTVDTQPVDPFATMATCTPP
jgi:hypothetical protein